MAENEKNIYGRKRGFWLALLILSLSALIGMEVMTYATIIIWDIDSDWSGGTFSSTQNVSGDLILNQTLSEYAISGNYVSNTTSTLNPISTVLPVWYSTEPNPNINVTVEISANGGTTWCIATNNMIMNSDSCADAGFGTGSSLLFRANLSTNDTAVTPMLHNITLDYTELTPYIEGNLTKPFDNTIVGQNRTFVANVTIYCRDGYCGDVNATIRYNKSSAAPDEPISTVAQDTPFYIIDGTNTKNCSTNPFVSGEFCNMTWTVNTTGNLSSNHLIDVLIQSNATLSNNTPDSTIEIGKLLIISLGFSQINFGILNPGDSDQPANDNAYGYNVMVDANSNDIENMWVKGTNLTNDDSGILNCNAYDRYNPVEGNKTIYPCIVNVSSVIWSTTSSPAPEEKYNLTGSYERVNKDMQIIPSGTNQTTYYWINVPFGIYAGPYTGTITYMVNATW